MNEQIERLWKHPIVQRYGIGFLILIIALGVLDRIALFSDLGFSKEIERYRWTILFIVLLGSIIFVFVNEFRILRSQREALKTSVGKLSDEIKDLSDQNASLFRLMEAYRVEAQADIFSRLKQLAVFSIKREEWSKKAKVERFRVEKLPNQKNEELNIVESITVFINLGSQDDAMKGMQFIIQDPTDTKKYGTIRVEECFAAGSACSVIEMNHPAFWSDIEKIRSDKKEKIIDAPANAITPHTPFRELNAESAKQILDWIRNLEEIEL
jgi:hypothetical protein